MPVIGSTHDDDLALVSHGGRTGTRRARDQLIDVRTIREPIAGGIHSRPRHGAAPGFVPCLPRHTSRPEVV